MTPSSSARGRAAPGLEITPILCDLIYLLKKDREKGAQPTSWTGVYMTEMEYETVPDAPLFYNAEDKRTPAPFRAANEAPLLDAGVTGQG